MYYTIATMEEIHSGFKVTYGHTGNCYHITIYSPENDIFRSREWAHNDRDAAQAMFLKIASWIMGGLYSDQDRVRMFLGEE